MCGKGATADCCADAVLKSQCWRIDAVTQLSSLLKVVTDGFACGNGSRCRVWADCGGSLELLISLDPENDGPFDDDVIGRESCKEVKALVNSTCHIIENASEKKDGYLPPENGTEAHTILAVELPVDRASTHGSPSAASEASV
ncbi:hypothetical protein Nepgr_017981 [Nepenthes gracilis]|uniref:Uncharacterized protein n=1 Tax=Nepenthes gracilis TaxID=150966 RepID=A0AAD3XTX1_NEPGR|nr:hypothetical protein Nepgr_017981 [Nepenthes gracilis]